jgi:CheY-like chemotaxis protein
MASGVAHDINNAVSPATLHVESLLEDEHQLSEGGRESLHVVERCLDDVTATVARMREFYRDQPKAAAKPVRLDEVAQQVIDLTRARWSAMSQQQGLLIEMKKEFAACPPIIGVESGIREALLNLLFNAVDAMPEGGILTVRPAVGAIASGSVIPQSVHLEVIDTGIGMDEDTRARCMEPFFTTKGERGTGLGLAMVFGVAQRHGAEFELESAPGKGTTVRLSFPLSIDATDTTVIADGNRARPLRILIIDDDVLLLKSLRSVLERDGHTVTAANAGQSGIETFHAAIRMGTAPFEAVITDLGMPHIDGRKVSAAVKNVSPSTPVILLTGWGQRMIQDGDTPKHVDRVLSKPPKLRELRLALAECCGAGELERPNPSSRKSAGV